MTAATTPLARVVVREDDARALAAELAAASRVAVDLEASGMFTYRARICTVQLAWGDQVAILDTLAAPARALAALLGPDGPTKIVHDVSFDARLLAEAGAPLAGVHDTSVAARMLGHTSTGLATLLAQELDVHIQKDLQQHDWRERPLDARMLDYLAHDVVHLASLEAKLWAQVTGRGIEAEVLEETRYRLASAADAVREPDTRPPYARVKGVERLSERDLAALRAIADVREREAERRDVPPHRVASAETLVAIARARPTTVAQVLRLRGVSRGPGDAARFVDGVVRAIAEAGETLSETERARFDRPRIPAAVLKARRDREGRLLSWRREEAKRRDVDEQVVLPGHCVKDAAGEELREASELARVPGLGAFRVERDGEAILRALRGPEATP